MDPCKKEMMKQGDFLISASFLPSLAFPSFLFTVIFNFSSVIELILLCYFFTIFEDGVFPEIRNTYKEGNTSFKLILRYWLYNLKVNINFVNFSKFSKKFQNNIIL